MHLYVANAGKFGLLVFSHVKFHYACENFAWQNLDTQDVLGLLTSEAWSFRVYRIELLSVLNLFRIKALDMFTRSFRIWKKSTLVVQILNGRTSLGVLISIEEGIRDPSFYRSLNSSSFICRSFKQCIIEAGWT